MKTIKRVLAATLALFMLLLPMAGCASKGKTMMELGDEEISVNLYQLFLSRMKGTLCSSYYFGTKALQDSFWDTVMSTDGTTYNDFYTDSVLSDTKTYLAALYIFEEKGLKLPDSYMEDIDKEMKRLIDEDGEGSKAKLNEILSEFGVNYKVLREAYILEAKIEYLKDTVYGEQGELIAGNLIEDYYQQTYRRFKQVFLYTYDYVYQTDDAGNYLLDDQGEKIPKTDGSGNVLIQTLPDAELEQVKYEAAQIYEQAETADYTGFDQLVEKYSMDTGMETYPNGYYMTKSTDYDSPEVVKKLFELEVGEYAKVESEYGIHIIMRYENEESAYSDQKNSDFFVSTETGGYVFTEDLKSNLLSQYLEQFKANIVIDQAVLAEADIKRAGVNYYY